MREQKITLGEMRSSGPTRVLVYCGDYKCAYSVVIDASHRGDDVRLSDLEPKFTCQACGHRGADIRPLFEVNKPASGYPAHDEQVSAVDRLRYAAAEFAGCTEREVARRPARVTEIIGTAREQNGDPSSEISQLVVTLGAEIVRNAMRQLIFIPRAIIAVLAAPP